METIKNNPRAGKNDGFRYMDDRLLAVKVQDIRYTNGSIRKPKENPFHLPSIFAEAIGMMMMMMMMIPFCPSIPPTWFNA